MKILFWSLAPIAILGAALCAYWSGCSVDRLPPIENDGPLIDRTSPTVMEPRVVRIVATPRVPSDPALQPRSQVLGEYRHAGDLDEVVREATSTNLAQLATFERQALMSDPHASDLERAERYHSAVLYESAIVALGEGSYVTTVPGEQKPPAQLPGAETVLTGVPIGGRSLRLTIIAAYDRFPELRTSRDLVTAAQQFDDWKKAEAFNALPEAERSQKTARILSLLRRGSLSSDELKSIYREIGRTGRLQPDTHTVVVR